MHSEAVDKGNGGTSFMCWEAHRKKCAQLYRLHVSAELYRSIHTQTVSTVTKSVDTSWNWKTAHPLRNFPRAKQRNEWGWLRPLLKAKGLRAGLQTLIKDTMATPGTRNVLRLLYRLCDMAAMHLLRKWVGTWTSLDRMETVARDRDKISEQLQHQPAPILLDFNTGDIVRGAFQKLRLW